MKKSKIIIFSILIIGAFALLYLLEQSDMPPKSEAKEFFDQYKGKPGFVIVTLPKFLINEIIVSENTENEKQSIHTVRMMIFHENKAENVKKKEFLKKIDENINSLGFTNITQHEKSTGTQKIFHKKKENNWNESILIFNNDSSIFCFDVINNLNKRRIQNFADSIDTDKINF